MHKGLIHVSMGSHMSMTLVKAPTYLQDISLELLGLTIVKMHLPMKDIRVKQSYCRLRRSGFLWPHEQRARGFVCTNLAKSHH